LEATQASSVLPSPLETEKALGLSLEEGLSVSDAPNFTIHDSRIPILALDIGGTKLAAALWDGSALLERAEMPTPTDDRSPDGVVGAALELLRPLAPRALALGVAATGAVANGRVTALNVDTLQGWDAFDLRGALEVSLHLPTVVLNDADAAGWGEYALGAGRGTRDFAFVTVSTGVGGGIVLNERLHTTSHGVHAELGYTLTPNGQPLELVASGGALDRWARERGWNDTRDIVIQALQGDAIAEGKLEESAGLIAVTLANLYVTLGVTRVAVGGGLGLAAGYLERVQRALRSFGEPWDALEVVRAQLGVDAGLIGAANWASRVD
jgi:N-acylmannosamine kinase